MLNIRPNPAPPPPQPRPNSIPNIPLFEARTEPEAPLVSKRGGSGIKGKKVGWKADRKPIVSEDDDPRVLCSYVPVRSSTLGKLEEGLFWS
jgi:hypothetical protein